MKPIIKLIQLVFYLVLFSLLLIQSGCGGNSGKEDTKDKNQMTILYLGDERVFHQDYWGMEATYWIFLPLVRNVGDERGEITPVLAERWTHSDDYRTWTVYLRKDVFWHDGVQMTAQDVKFSVEMKREAYGGEDDIFIMDNPCEIIDDFTFRFNFINPQSGLPSWEVYYPKHLLEELDPAEYYNWDFWTHPVGNGPYRFVRSVPKTMVEVEANPNYFLDKPKIESARLKFSANASLPELLSGNVDALTYVPRDMLLKTEGDKRFTSYYSWGGWLETIYWNHRNPLFVDARVRRALTMAINRQELSEVLNYPEGVPVSDVICTSRQRVSSDKPDPLPFNPEAALKLLQECGWEDTNGDHILNKDGTDFRFTLTVNTMETGSNNLMETYVQENFRQIGVSMGIETMERSVSMQRLSNGDFEATRLRFFNHESNQMEMQHVFGEESNIGYWNPEIDSLLKLIYYTGDTARIDSLYLEIMPILANDIPLTFLLPQVQTYIVRSNIKGLKNLYRADPVWFMEFLSLEKD